MSEPSGRVAELAEERELGAYRFTETFQDIGMSCLAVFFPPIFVLAGILTLVRGAVVVGVVLLVIAPVWAVLFWRAGMRVFERAPKMYCYARGFVLTGKRAADPRPYLWNEVDVEQRVEYHNVGQAQTRKAFAKMDIKLRDTGAKLLTLGEAQHIIEVRDLATKSQA